ncbi:DotH/IcmK family type IV secretion protein [Paucibacter soli]|uniref:DotH/IcmK family type IV secretion protein n=1 Tax=Paucibacter soli TaxID=3133433 RepID=UPI0030ADE8B1
MNRYQINALIFAAMTVTVGASWAQQGASTPAAAASAPAAVIPKLPKDVAALATSDANKPGVGLSPEQFGALLNQQMPLSPNQVRQVNQVSDAVKQARNARVGPAPKPVSVTARVKLSAGAEPHILRLSSDTVTSVIFNDVTGAPWNVVRVIAGAKDLLDISRDKDAPGTKTNMFTIVPLDDHISTNVAVFLEGAPAPVVMVVATNQKEVDFRADISVQARGPAAVMPAISRGLAESVSAELTTMVSGLTPAQAKPLKVVSSDFPEISAWVIGERMYVRSKANVLAPPVPKDGKVATGADGTKVYELPHAPEVLLMQGGSVGRLKLSGFSPPTMTQIATK